MPWVYVWNVTGEKAHEVRLELGVLGREVVKVDGQTVADAYSLRFKRRVPLSLGAGHTAGLEISVARGWPSCSLSFDGRTVAATRRPRVPLWSLAFALVCAATFATPLGAPDLMKGALRGGATGAAIGLCLYAGAATESMAVGILLNALLAAGAWGVAFGLR